MVVTSSYFFQVGTMTTDQIREMMANTLKELNERKKALANLKGDSTGAKSAFDSGVQKVPLPPPKVITIDAPPDKAKTIAALQAQIASRLNKLAPQIPAAAASLQGPAERPAAVILDEKGRTVDDKGQEIQMHYEPTLKANLRAKKRDELRDNLKFAADAVDHQDQVRSSTNVLLWCSNKLGWNPLGTYYPPKIGSLLGETVFTFRAGVLRV